MEREREREEGGGVVVRAPEDLSIQSEVIRISRIITHTRGGREGGALINSEQKNKLVKSVFLSQQSSSSPGLSS
jgi:hypothetical protein